MNYDSNNPSRPPDRSTTNRVAAEPPAHADRGTWAIDAGKEDLLGILESLPCGVVLNDGKDSHVLYINPAAFKLLGYSVSDIPTGKMAKRTFTPDKQERQRIQGKIRRRINRFGSSTIIGPVPCKDGSTKTCEVTSMFLPNGMKMSMWIDVTQREKVLGKSRDELRDLSEYIQKAREEERQRIARELHDEFGQFLSALKVDVLCVEKDCGNGSAVPSDHVLSMAKNIDQAIERVRDICWDLRPVALDHLGLGPAVEWELERLHKATGISYSVRISKRLEFIDKELSQVLFNILREALTNVIRHAGATAVTVALKTEGEKLLMRIVDNGVGMPHGKASGLGSLGFLGIRERLRFWNGELKIRTGKGKGVALSVVVPLNASKAKSIMSPGDTENRI
jgi:two-component system, NarL family, sensor histidine kinase UhpB